MVTWQALVREPCQPIVAMRAIIVRVWGRAQRAQCPNNATRPPVPGTDMRMRHLLPSIAGGRVSGRIGALIAAGHHE
jgi:hypothetical protein